MATLAPPIGFKFGEDDLNDAGLMWQISRERYHELIDAGMFADDRVELIHGYIIRKMAVNPPHILVLKLLVRYLIRLLSADWHLSFQDPIATDDSEPEPDIAVIRGDPLDYADRLPQGDELGLVIEISATTLAYDRKVKTALYAAAGIEQYWIVDVEGRLVEVHTNPVVWEDNAEYLDKQIYDDGELIMVTIDGQAFGEIAVAQIMPPL